MCTKMDWVNLIVNICIAIGTIGATFVALGIALGWIKPKEKLSGEVYKITYTKNKKPIMHLKVQNNSRHNIYLGYRDITNIPVRLPIQVGVINDPNNRENDFVLYTSIDNDNLCLTPTKDATYFYYTFKISNKILPLKGKTVYLLTNNGGRFKMDVKLDKNKQ